mgnify:CR=1 FL=1
MGAVHRATTSIEYGPQDSAGKQGSRCSLLVLLRVTHRSGKNLAELSLPLLLKTLLERPKVTYGWVTKMHSFYVHV